MIDPLSLGLAARALNHAEPLRSLAISPASVKRVAIFGDSFVGGAGATDPKTFAVPLAAALRARYGDAGAGYIPWVDGKMGGISHSAGYASVSANGPGTSLYRWDADPRKALMFGGLGYYRDGGAGDTDGNESLFYAPNVADSFVRGVADTLTHARVYFALRSAKAGFQLRQSDIGQNAAPNYSSGASFTGVVSATTLTASAVTGVIPRTGARILGGVTNTTTLANTPGGTNKGGAGTYSLNTSQTVGSTAMTADPNIEPVLNLPQVADYFFDPAKANNLSVLGTYGDIVVSGVEHFNGNAGVTVSDFGVGGTTAYQFASLDPAAQRRFFELANFDLVIFVLGMNDRSARPEGLYGSDMARLVSWAQRGASTKVMLVRQTDPSDAASTYIKNYGPVLQNVARSFGCGYYDMRTASADLATYAAASAAGLMEDGVHLKASANTVVGNHLAGLISL